MCVYPFAAYQQFCLSLSLSVCKEPEISFEFSIYHPIYPLYHHHHRPNPVVF